MNQTVEGQSYALKRFKNKKASIWWVCDKIYKKCSIKAFLLHRVFFKVISKSHCVLFLLTQYCVLSCLVSFMYPHTPSNHSSLLCYPLTEKQTLGMVLPPTCLIVGTVFCPNYQAFFVAFFSPGRPRFTNISPLTESNSFMMDWPNQCPYLNLTELKIRVMALGLHFLNDSELITKDRLSKPLS